MEQSIPTKAIYFPSVFRRVGYRQNSVELTAIETQLLHPEFELAEMAAACINQ